MKSKDCSYNKKIGVLYACIVESDKTDIIKECHPLSTACERSVKKEHLKGIPLYKTERLA